MSEGHLCKLHDLIKAEALVPILSNQSIWIHSDDNGVVTTVLHCIVRLGSLAFLRSILQTPLIALLNSVDGTHRTPLYYAVEAVDLERVRLLLGAGARIRCFERRHGVAYSVIDKQCPFALTVGKADGLDMAILLLTAQRRPFPDGHDHGCCFSFCKPSYIVPSYETLTVPDPKVMHLIQCEDEMDERKARATDTFYPFLFYLKRAMAGANHNVYSHILLPMLRTLWFSARYDGCWKEKK